MISGAAGLQVPCKSSVLAVRSVPSRTLGRVKAMRNTALYTWPPILVTTYNNHVYGRDMNKQLAFATNVDHLSEIPQEIRDTFIKQFEQYESEQKQQKSTEATALLSQDEIEQLNSAVESIADKLGISGELAAIDALLKARNTRAARILTAAYGSEG